MTIIFTETVNTEAFDRQVAVHIQRHTGLSEGERQDFDSFGGRPVLIAADVSGL